MTFVTDAQVASVPGWFDPIDVAAFRVLLSASIGGDLAEMGVYRGRSAVLSGSYLRPDETFTVVDLFEADSEDEANRTENLEQYPTLTRRKFESTYRSLHGHLPVIVQGLSARLDNHASVGSHRFVHIDASHLYDHVVEDLIVAKRLLKPDGVVVLDDYRTEHTPGVAAASWQAVANGLRPFLLTPLKLYATWGDPRPWQAAISSWLRINHQVLREVQIIDGNELTRVWSRGSWIRKYVPPAVMPTLSRLRMRIKR